VTQYFYFEPHPLDIGRSVAQNKNIVSPVTMVWVIIAYRTQVKLLYYRMLLLY
jgi:hypothetical protein